MLVFKTSKIKHPIAEAIKAYASYLDLPASVRNDVDPINDGEIPIQMIASEAMDARAMRMIEQFIGDKIRLVLLLSPAAHPGPLADALTDMPHVFRMDPNVTAGPFVQRLRGLVSAIELKKDFYIDFMKAEIAMENGQTTEAVSIVQTLQRAGVDPFACHILLARILFAAGTFEGALKQAQLAVRSRETSLAARSLVAAIYQKMGDSAKAEAVMEQSLEVAEASMSYLVQLGDVYFEQGKVDKSKAAYKKAKELDPNNKQADEGLLAVSLLEGDFKAATESVSAKGLNFDLARFCNLKGVSLSNNRRYEDAEKMYLNTIGMLGKSPDVYKIQFNLGLCLKKAGNIAKALKYFEDCKALAPVTFTRIDEQLENVRKKKAG